MAVVLKVFSENFIGPQSCENLVGVVSILELFIELVRSASVCNATVKSNQPEGKVSGNYWTRPQLLMEYSRLAVMEEGEDHLDVPCSDVRICHDFLLTQQEAC